MNYELYFEESGSGNVTIVLLHYFGGSSRTWNAVITFLKDKARCLAIDMPGFGASAPLSPPSTVENAAQSVAALLVDLGVTGYILVGHSMGGKIAMQAASLPSSSCKQLILVAPSPPTPEPMNEEKRKSLLAAFGNKKALGESANGLVAEPLSATELKNIVDDNLRIHRQTWRDWIDVGSKEDISSAVKNIRLPVTVISGEKDPDFSTSFLQKEIGACLPQAKFIEIKNAGHLLPVEVPALLARTIFNASEQ